MPIRGDRLSGEQISVYLGLIFRARESHQYPAERFEGSIMVRVTPTKRKIPAFTSRCIRRRARACAAPAWFLSSLDRSFFLMALRFGLAVKPSAGLSVGLSSSLMVQDPARVALPSAGLASVAEILARMTRRLLLRGCWWADAH